MLISMDYKFNQRTGFADNIFEYYFSQVYLKRFASDLLTIETEHNFKYNKQIIFSEEVELYHE